MGKLFKAAIGFAIALTVLDGNAFWAELDSRSVHDLRAAIDREDPYGRLTAMAGEGAAALSARFGTDTAPPQARRLHP